MRFKPLTIDPSVVSLQSQQTIQSILDAIVELVTNSADSYRKSRTLDTRCVEIDVRSDDRGLLKELTVKDWASGMDENELENALTYGRKASGFDEHEGIRGYFGRGLKEAIIALGEGTITTRKNGAAFIAQLRRGHKAHHEVGIEPVATEFAESAGLHSSGTIVRITAKLLSEPKDRWKVHKPESLVENISQHYALRHIVKELHLTISWNVMERRGSKTIRRKQDFPVRIPPVDLNGEIRIDQIMKIDGHKAKVSIFESSDPLSSTPGDPSSLAGIVITTENVPIDLKLLSGPEAYRYFYGTVEIPEIAAMLRRGDHGIVNANRSGLNWSKHAFAKKIQKFLVELLAPLIAEKEASIRSQVRPTEEEAKILRQDVAFLNKLFKQLDLELDGGSNSEGGEQLQLDSVTQLTLKPEVATIRPGESRPLSVYLPAAPRQKHAYAHISIESPDSAIELDQRRIELKPHPKHQKLLYGTFRVRAKPSSKEGDFALVECTSDDHPAALGEIRVGEPGDRETGTDPKSKHGGFLKDIEFDDYDDPTQRVVYDRSKKVLTIYTRFPGLEDLRDSPGAVSGEPGLTLYAELLAEGLCKAKCLQRFARGEVSFTDDPESSVVRCFGEYDSLRKLCLKGIQSYVRRARGGLAK